MIDWGYLWPFSYTLIGIFIADYVAREEKLGEIGMISLVFCFFGLILIWPIIAFAKKEKILEAIDNRLTTPIRYRKGGPA